MRAAVLARAAAVGLDLRFVDDSTIGFSLDETSTLATVHAVLSAFHIAAETADPETAIRRPRVCRGAAPTSS